MQGMRAVGTGWPSGAPAFLQHAHLPCPFTSHRAGLTAYGRGGRLIAGGQLPMDVVRAAFEFSARHDVPVCGFLGEECVTHKMHPELEELHHRRAGGGAQGWAGFWAVGGASNQRNPGWGVQLCAT